MSALSAGRLDQRVTLQQRDAGIDAHGQQLGEWSDVATVWAQAEPLRGRELFAAGTEQSAVEVRFRIRWRGDVTPTMRLLWRGQAHDIVSVIDPFGGRQALELMCAAGVRDGR